MLRSCVSDMLQRKSVASSSGREMSPSPEEKQGKGRNNVECVDEYGDVYIQIGYIV